MVFLFLILFWSWNIRGLNDPLKQKEVRNWIREQKLSFCGLVETKVKAVNKEKILRSIAYQWEAVYNYDSSPRGRIRVCWDPSAVQVAVIGQSDQCMHCRVQ